MPDRIELVAGDVVIASRVLTMGDVVSNADFVLTDEEVARWPNGANAHFAIVPEGGVKRLWYDTTSLHVIGNDGRERIIYHAALSYNPTRTP